MSKGQSNDGKRRRNKRWPEGLKREIVAASYVPGTSVSEVARQYDVSASQIFDWRHRFRDTCLPLEPVASKTTPQLVPVSVIAEPEVDQTGLAAPVASVAPGVSDAIEIEVSDGSRIRVGAGFDSAALKRILDVLRVR